MQINNISLHLSITIILKTCSASSSTNIYTCTFTVNVEHTGVQLQAVWGVTLSQELVICKLAHTYTGSLHAYNIALYIDSNLSFRFNFTIHTKTYLTPPFVGLLIYVIIQHTCYRSRSALLSLKQFCTSLGKVAIFANVSRCARTLRIIKIVT